MDKHFADWKMDVHGVREEVEVRTTFDGVNWAFVAIHKGTNGDKDIKLTDTDIMKLQNTMRKRLEENMKLDWKPYLLIEVDSDFRDIGEEIENEVSGRAMPWEAKLEIQVTRVQLSTDRSGTQVRRDGPGEQVHKGWPDVGPPEHKSWSTKDQTCMIEDTPRNRDLLRLIFGGMQDIKKRFCSAFAPEKIEKTLEAISSSKMLPFTEEKTTKKRR